MKNFVFLFEKITLSTKSLNANDEKFEIILDRSSIFSYYFLFY